MDVFVFVYERNEERKKIVCERISCDIFDVFLIYVFVR